jgi:hypothetical protein
LRQGVDGQPKADRERLRDDRDARHAHLADEQQMRRTPQLDPLVVNRRDRPADEVDGHGKPAARTDWSRRQRDHPAGDRGDGLIRAEDDRPALVRNGDGARFLADRELKGCRQLVQSDELLLVGNDERDRPASLARDQR